MERAHALLAGARKVCSQRVIGSAAGERREIDWSMYATKDNADVDTFYVGYSGWHGLKSDVSDNKLTLVSPEGTGRLTVHDNPGSFPDCGVRPAADEKSIIIVSRASS